MAEPDQPEEVAEGANVFYSIPEDVDADPLLLAVIHAIMFLTGSSELIVDPHSADEACDHMFGYLERIRGKDLDRLKASLDKLSQYARKQKWPADKIAFFEEFMDIVGLTGEERS